MTEIEREETKPNDLFDTLESNPLYSRDNHELIGRQVQHSVGSMEARPVSKWSQEAENYAKERGPVTYDRVPEDSKPESEEEARFNSNEKSDLKNFGSEDKSFGERSGESNERTNDKVAEE